MNISIPDKYIQNFKNYVSKNDEIMMLVIINALQKETLREMKK